MKKATSKNAAFQYEAFATAILAKRNESGLTLREMSESTKLPIGTCHRAEAVANKLDIETIIPICNWLDMPIQAFVTAVPKSKVNGKKH